MVFLFLIRTLVNLRLKLLKHKNLLPPLFATDLNTGIILWMQQFYGLLVKRFLHSIRNWRAIITQLVVPIIFILLGLILVHTVPGTDSPDESRSLNIPDSALEDDIIAFYAELGSGDPIFTVSIYCFSVHECQNCFYRILGNQSIGEQLELLS